MSSPNPYAFPGERYEQNDHITYQEGMTLRDWFAGQALAGMLANPRLAPLATELMMVTQAFCFADVFLAERAKTDSGS